MPLLFPDISSSINLLLWGKLSSSKLSFTFPWEAQWLVSGSLWDWILPGYGQDSTLNEALLVLCVMSLIPASSRYLHFHKGQAVCRTDLSDLFYQSSWEWCRCIRDGIQMSFNKLVITSQYVEIWILSLASRWQELYEIYSVPKARHCTLFFLILYHLLLTCSIVLSFRVF